MPYSNAWTDKGCIVQYPEYRSKMRAPSCQRVENNFIVVAHTRFDSGQINSKCNLNWNCGQIKTESINLEGIGSMLVEQWMWVQSRQRDGVDGKRVVMYLKFTCRAPCCTSHKYVWVNLKPTKVVPKSTKLYWSSINI